MTSIMQNPIRFFLMIALAVACFGTAAQAQDKPQKHRGPVISVDVAANTITIDHKKKGELTLKLAADCKVKPKSVGGLAGIKAGDNVICYSPPEGGDVLSIRVQVPEGE